MQDEECPLTIMNPFGICPTNLTLSTGYEVQRTHFAIKPDPFDVELLRKPVMKTLRKELVSFVGGGAENWAEQLGRQRNFGITFLIQAF